MNKDQYAFPKTPFVEVGTPQNGMTLRDYFAAKAMQEWVGVFNPDDGAVRAYKWADAMLEARKQ
jgi:hypothetical protein